MMAASRLDPFRPDLKTIVSKYLGDTEKNLETIFTAAVATAAVLFFDEADALFGKRNEVRDAHDRYPNLEIDYPRQRIETSQALVILATSLTVMAVLGLCLIPRGGRPKGGR
jgi:SpoVK/Ycf46/Vps4 family AAA+-type ATPase